MKPSKTEKEQQTSDPLSGIAQFFQKPSVQSLSQKLLEWTHKVWDTLFTSQPQRGYTWVVWGWIIGLYLAGVAAWGRFFNWGDIPFDFHDWAEVNAKRLAFVRDALQQGVLTLHMNQSWPLRGVTDRYLVIPDVITSPQMVLMRYLDIGDFLLVDLILLYTLGVVGLLWLRRKYHLSPVSFGFLFLIFSFNGYIQSHLSVGHITWLGYFMLPWLIGLALEVFEGSLGWAWIAKFAFVEFFIILQGSYHMYIASLLFMGVLAISAWRRFWPIFAAMAFSGLLSAVRLLPPVLGFGRFSVDFLSGFPNLKDFVHAFIALIGPVQGYAERLSHNSLGWWEYDMFIGMVGAALVAYFGGFCWVRDLLKGKSRYAALFIPVAVVTVLTLGKVFRLINETGIPLFASERVSSRMVIIPFMAVAVLAAIYFQRWLDRAPLVFEVRLVCMAFLLSITNDLWDHLNQWKVSAAFNAFPTTPVNLTSETVVAYSDPIYDTVVIVGASLTVIMACFLLAMAWKESRKRTITAHEVDADN